MIEQIKKASELLATQIKYQDTPEHPHEYTRIDNGKLLAGVSSISELAKTKESGGFLAQWKVNEAIEYIKEHSLCGKKEVRDIFGNYICDIVEYYVKEGTLKEAKYAHKVKGKEATDIGTRIHEILEEYVNAKINKIDYVLGTGMDKPIVDLFEEDFINWETTNNVQWLASELLVGDLENDVAGRLDGLAMVNGKLTIVDFKAANNIPSNYFLQLSGYALCLETMGIKVEDRIIIRLPKTEKRKVWIEEIKQYKMVDNKIEFITPKTDWEFDKECFIHARQLYKWLNYSNKK